MAALPTPGGSDGTYGTELNEYLEVEHEADGTHGALTPTSISATGNITTTAFINLGAGSELTISGGVVTATNSHHAIDTESDDSTDNLDTINGGSTGDVLVVRPINSARTIIAKDGVGNLRLAGDFTMDISSDMLFLLKLGANWVEISRSDNGT